MVHLNRSKLAIFSFISSTSFCFVQSMQVTKVSIPWREQLKMKQQLFCSHCHKNPSILQLTTSSLLLNTLEHVILYTKLSTWELERISFYRQENRLQESSYSERWEHDPRNAASLLHSCLLCLLGISKAPWERPRVYTLQGIWLSLEHKKDVCLQQVTKSFLSTHFSMKT